MEDICLVAEHLHGKLKRTTLNALTCCRQAADLWGGRVHLLVLGNDVTGVAEELHGYGAEWIWLAEDPALEHCLAESWGHVIARAVEEKIKAPIIAMTSGTTGKDLMPRVAAELKAGLASDVVGLDGRNFVRPLWAGSVLATVEIVTPFKALTIQPTAFDPAEPTGGQTPIERLEVHLPRLKTRFVELKATRSDRPDLTEAGVIVSGGRGLDSGGNFRLLEDLADLLHGAVGATRAAVDEGWAPNDLQVGQTGKIVAPDLYFAVGLSGSTQHKAGMKNSKVIVAVNTDEEAPIFEIADFGLVADLFEALPELTEKLKKVMASA